MDMPANVVIKHQTYWFIKTVRGWSVLWIAGPINRIAQIEVPRPLLNANVCIGVPAPTSERANSGYLIILPR